MKIKQTLPKWFNGTIYEKGEIITNPYSNESYRLTAKELSIYDLIRGAEMMINVGDWESKEQREELIDIILKGLDWFRKYNSKAYMVLLD